MTKRVSSINKVLAALPAAQKSIGLEIQARIDAGETIASMGGAEMRARSIALLDRLRTTPLPKKSAA